MQPQFSRRVEGSILEQKLAKPECIGVHLAKRIGNRSVVELCSCIGVALIQIAKSTNKTVTGVDINEDLVRKANKNAEIYGVKNVTFVVGDATNEELLKTLKADVVIIDPHWSVSKTLSRDFANTLESTQPPADLLVSLVRKYITQNIVVQLPPNMSDEEIQKLGKCEIESVYVNGELKDKTVYLGDLVKSEKSKASFEYEKVEVPEEMRNIHFS